MKENKGAKTIVFYEAKLPFKKKESQKEPKRGPRFFKKRRASAAQGAFWKSEKNRKTGQKTIYSNLRELGTGSAFVFGCCASNCEHSHRCPRSLCEAVKAQEPARTPPRARVMRPNRP